VEFLSANRTLSQYSVATLQRQALDRDILLTQNVYTQAVTDREAAKARELEETPVLVIVDSLAAQFGTKPRYSMIAALAGALAALLLSLFVIFLTEQFRRQAHADDPDVQRLNAAIRSLPGVSMLDRTRDARPADIRVD
jgi:uncharacterized protein involved in exopolysaccharide biosynthesis